METTDRTTSVVHRRMESYRGFNVSTSPETRATLLLRLRNTEDSEAWRQFVQIYEPLIRRVAKRFGMQSVDAEELTQEVLVTVLNKLPAFQLTGQPGSFRKWLATVARNAAISQLRKAQRRDKGFVAGDIADLASLVEPANEKLEEQFDREERMEIFRWAAEQVRANCDANTWNAFWRTTVLQQSIESVASELQISVGQIYVARCRTLARLKELVEPFQASE
jgi:RNA polymerase sigma-70 factor, ECF subfamily